MHAITWFELATTELGRAVEFYEAVFAVKLKVEAFEGMEMALFPTAECQEVGGALVRDPRRAPGMDGGLVYFATHTSDGGLDGCLARAAARGAEIVLPRTDIGPPGFIALLKDSEGNLIGLHAPR